MTYQLRLLLLTNSIEYLIQMSMQWRRIVFDSSLPLSAWRPSFNWQRMDTMIWREARSIERRALRSWLLLVEVASDRSCEEPSRRTLSVSFESIWASKSWSGANVSIEQIFFEVKASLLFVKHVLWSSLYSIKVGKDWHSIMWWWHALPVYRSSRLMSNGSCRFLFSYSRSRSTCSLLVLPPRKLSIWSHLSLIEHFKKKEINERLTTIKQAHKSMSSSELRQRQRRRRNPFVDSLWHWRWARQRISSEYFINEDRQKGESPLMCCIN